jgi:hypothetical protein
LTTLSRLRILTLISSEDPSASDIVSARRTLLKTLQPWLAAKASRFPDLRDLSPLPDIDEPERITLHLPSHWTGANRPPELQPLVPIEKALRQGQCHDALDKLRLAIKTFNANRDWKKMNIRGQTANTRAQDFLKTLDSHKVSAHRKYTNARNALLNLGFSVDDKTFRPLLQSELWGRDMGAPLELGDTRNPEPWFWTFGRPTGMSTQEEADWELRGT